MYLPTFIYGEYNTVVGAELHVQRRKVGGGSVFATSLVFTLFVK
jgi:hypothetical protein